MDGRVPTVNILGVEEGGRGGGTKVAMNQTGRDWLTIKMQKYVSFLF